MSDRVAMWAAAGLAALFAGWRFWRLMGARVDVEAATKLLVRLVLLDNLGAARKVCAAMPRAVYMIAMRAALAAPDDPRPAFEDAFGRAMAPLEANRWMDLAALAAGLTSVVIAVTAASVPIQVLIVGAAAAVAALLNMRSMRRVRVEVPGGFAAVMKALMRKRSADRSSGEAKPEPKPESVTTGTALLLSASVDGVEIGRLALDRDVVKVGTIPSSQLRLDHPSVSRMHAIIETTDEGSTVIDLGSSAGTRINGEKINKAVIAAGDEIEFGQVLVRVSSGPGEPVTTPAPPTPMAAPAPMPPATSTGTIQDLRHGTCPLCRGSEIAQRPAVSGDLVPWVCQSCGYAQLFAPR